MICTSKNIKDLLGRYCFFFDAVILSFFIFFVESTRNIKVQVRCRNVDNRSILVELYFRNVTAWAFSCGEKEAPEVVTEGFRFRYDDKWKVDFGDDPDLPMTDIDWIDLSNKFIIAGECTITEKDIE